MMSIFYFVLLLFSIGNLIYLAQKKYKHTDRYLWTLIIIIPIIILGYWLKSTVHTPEAAMIAFCFIYLDSTVMLVICLFTILMLTGINVSSKLKTSVYGVTVLHLLSIWLTKDSDVYYADIELRETYLGTATKMTSGPLKATHYLFLAIIFVTMIVSLVYGYSKKGNYSKRTLRIYSAFIVFAIILYIVEIIFNFDYSFLPLIYAIGSFCASINYEHFQSHDMANLIGEKQSITGLRGFAAFDKNRCLLGYNQQFAGMIPEITNVGIDEMIQSENDGLIGNLYPAITQYVNENIESQNIVCNDKIYNITVSPFSVSANTATNGYLIEIADVTEDVKKRDIIEKYNEVLSKEVKEKTEHIAEIQNTVVLGLANMIENRDDNTGGHVKRTSDVIKILVDEIMRRNAYNLDKDTADAIVKAAPMHDLGKISIDNSILCKPGKLTDEEFAIMKTHSTKSAEIVKIILEGVEAQRFVNIAYNLAKHHHERWDGRGYPDGLLGETIPLEARIMAVADVYDALVSKRCYKEAMSFDKAFEIMNECMGSQFDPAMRPIFVACRQKLENYYSDANQD